MARPWFKRRDRGFGVGYGIVSWEGVVVLLVFFGVTWAGLHWVMPWTERVGLPPIVGALGMMLPLIALLFWVIRLTSDD